MAIRLMTAVWDDESLPRGDVLLMLALADHANDDGACFPSINRLARRTRSSASTVRRHLRSLREAGRLTIDAREGTSNLYRIVLRGDGWQYAPAQPDTPSVLTPLPPRDGGTPSTAVPGGAVTAVAPEPSSTRRGTDRYPRLLASRPTSPDRQAEAGDSQRGDAEGLGVVSPSAAWLSARDELTARFPSVAWRGWTPTHDVAAERHLARLGDDLLLRVAGRPTRPDLAVAWLRRWEREAAPRPARPSHRCPDHLVTHHGICPGCRADQLVAH
ncbi:helix-turn-helix domain-containing protein [Aquipuribacter hungaricus]|uniref:Helix-turn-helix domain-containing protein n=1 Tax=Aquipuribacter hungaricus TaxID=545624 RepID=A0ABV7WGH8_9MICO